MSPFKSFFPFYKNFNSWKYNFHLWLKVTINAEKWKNRTIHWRIFMEVFAWFSLAHEIYYFAILVERQILFGDTVQISSIGKWKPRESVQKDSSVHLSMFRVCLKYFGKSHFWIVLVFVNVDSLECIRGQSKNIYMSCLYIEHLNYPPSLSYHYITHNII